MPENYSVILSDMVAVAREAGSLTQGYFKRFRELEIGIKGPADFVSDADKESEQLIRKYLFARYPDWSFTGEEFPPVDGADREHRWLVDPIDGTTNFINGQHYTISIALRRGNETVCVLREEGSFPVRSFVLHEGVRFPLGVASAGTAIMAFLPEEEQDVLLTDWEAHAGDFAAGHPAGVVRENLEKTRLAGYSVNPGLVLEGSWGMGAAVFDPQGRPAWALSLTGIEPRFRGDRQEFLGKLLLEEAHRMTSRLQRSAPN